MTPDEFWTRIGELLDGCVQVIEKDGRFTPVREHSRTVGDDGLRFVVLGNETAPTHLDVYADDVVQMQPPVESGTALLMGELAVRTQPWSTESEDGSEQLAPGVFRRLRRELRRTLVHPVDIAHVDTPDDRERVRGVFASDGALACHRNGWHLKQPHVANTIFVPFASA